MKYSIHGPFKLTRGNKGRIDRSPETKKMFWNDVFSDDPDLEFACGCYIFGIQNGDNITPWYIGMASKQSFKSECMKPYQVNIYNDIVLDHKGYPVFLFIAKRTKTNKIRKVSSRSLKDIVFLETLLIGMGIEKNPRLMNISKTKFLKEMVVPTILNTPRRASTKAEKFLRKTFH